MPAAIEEQTGVFVPVPDCLWQENLHRPVSLLDMLRFNAHHFVGISSTLGQAMMDIRSNRVPQESTMTAIGGQCGLLLKYCEDLDLPLSVAHLKRLRDDILKPGLNLTALADALHEVHVRVWDELGSRTFLALSPSEAASYEKDQFAPIVFERFPDATFDASEAGKCIALERPTACVFHLMRVTEYGLQAVGKLLKIKDPRPNWEPVITKIDAELKKPYQDREFKGNADLLAHISAHFNAVKIAWRNRAMHVDRKHTPEEAREIYAATAGLMRYLAENLPKESTVIRAIRGILGS